jgi:hypothetical protein
MQVIGQNPSEKYIVKMPRLSTNLISKLNRTTNISLQSIKNSKTIKNLSYVKENTKKNIQKNSKLSSVRKRPSCTKIASKILI